MIRSSVNLDCFISVFLQVTDSTHFWKKFRGSGHLGCSDRRHGISTWRRSRARAPVVRWRSAAKQNRTEERRSRCSSSPEKIASW